MSDALDDVIQAVRDAEHRLRLLMETVFGFFDSHPKLTAGKPPLIHSVRRRMKDYDHLRKKIVRKREEEGRIITRENVFEEITDLVGVRVLHLHQDQFPQIHGEIIAETGPGRWQLHEDPKAYTWDRESEATFRSLGISTGFKESHYTSVHYVIRPNSESPLRCEIQVRTLFEEVWGEIDHAINYPVASESIPCREQLRVLAKLVGTGTRLADAIFRTHRAAIRGAVRVEDPGSAGAETQQPGAPNPIGA